MNDVDVNTDDLRSLVLYNFRMLHDYNKYINKNTWKSKAYAIAMKTVEETPSDEFKTKEDLRGLRLSKSMLEKAEWIFENRTNVPEVDDVRANGDIRGIRLLSSVHNIGVSKAVDLVRNHGIKDLEQLGENLHLLNDLQKKGLRFHEDIVQRIPREEMTEHKRFLEHHMNVFNSRQDAQIDFYITGSYRRGESTSGDIDVLVCPRTDLCQNAKRIVKSLVEYFRSVSYVPENGTFALGDKKFMGMCKLPNRSINRRLDLIITTTDELPFMLLYFTGNGDFNVKMRDHVKRNGYLLNECGLFKDSEKVSHTFRTEEDIFSYLNVNYLPPHERRPENLLIFD